jgi:hypothetical protein
MQISPAHFVPTGEIRKITSGSYEHLISRIEEALTRDRSHLFGEETAEVRVVGTFDKYVVAATSDNRFFKVPYSDQNGKVETAAGVQIEVPVYTPETMHEWVKKEAARTVQAFLSGGLTEMQERLAEMLPFVDRRSLPTDSDLAVGAVARIHNSRTWRQMADERREHFRKFLGDEEVARIESQPSPRFNKLYEGAASPEDRTSLIEAVRALETRVGALVESVEDSYKALETVAPQAEKLGEEGVLAAFGSFAKDLLEDLREIRRVVTESSAQISSVDSLSKVHDAVAEELPRCEIAGRFFVQMTRRLTEARVE